MKGNTTVDVVNKMIHIDLEGFAAVEQTSQKVDDLEARVNAMKDVKDWSIIIACENLSTFQPGILPILERCYKNIYEKFKHAVLVNPAHPVARMQLQRVARTTAFTGKFVATKDEAIAICRS